eukprot:COSAG02_NODE_1331_length_13215_cov_3.173058_6_plen_552_part_00
MPRHSALPLHTPLRRSAPPSGQLKRRAIVVFGGLLVGAFLLNFAFISGVDDNEQLEAAALAEMAERARVKAQPELLSEVEKKNNPQQKHLSEAEQEAIEAEAMREAIAAPLIGTDGEDRSLPAPREESGAGRRDDIHAGVRDHHGSVTKIELPSDPELPDENEGGMSDDELLHVGPPPPRPPPPSPPPSSVNDHMPQHLPGVAARQKTVQIGGCIEDQFSAPLVSKAQFEAAWGGCWTEGGREVLVALPYSADMLCELRRIMFTQLKAMECANPGFNLRLGLYDKPYVNDMNAAKTKKSGRGVLATLRNALLAEYLNPAHELVLWLDADVVSYPADMVEQLYNANPGGVSAPLVLIEESDTEEFHNHLCKHPLCHMGMQRKTRHIRQWSDRRYKQFYDRAAFIASNTNITMNKAFPGNSLPLPPYLGGVDGWTSALASGTVECESVGTVYMIPADVYRSTSIADQVRLSAFTKTNTAALPCNTAGTGSHRGDAGVWRAFSDCVYRALPPCTCREVRAGKEYHHSNQCGRPACQFAEVRPHMAQGAYEGYLG